MFNNPSTADKTKIASQLITLINGAETGSDIRVAAFEFTDPDVLAALKAAHAKGVNVKVLISERRACRAPPSRTRASSASSSTPGTRKPVPVSSWASSMGSRPSRRARWRQVNAARL
ncbi:phospholipase D-like domain-containing protein [Nonomuraea sp. NPDC046802]|uniref:phospholipase D-like domain-containing protein n=1 Tax=Nonomuraea sp. NPDC046802 TaxID=3154919 RepID=UPI0033D0AEB6